MSNKKTNSLFKKLVNNGQTSQISGVQKQITKFDFEKPNVPELKKQVKFLQQKEQTEEIKEKIRKIKSQIRHTWSVEDKKNYADSKENTGFNPQNQNDKLFQMAKEATKNLNTVEEKNTEQNNIS